MIRPRIFTSLFGFAALILTLAPASDACRFNVRDVGFVEFNRKAYQLYFVYDDSTPETLTKSVDTIGFAALLDGNIDLVSIQTSDAGHDAVMDFLSSTPDRPAFVLESPEGDFKRIPCDLTGNTSQDALWTALETIASSPKRTELMDDCLEHYGVALFIEGNNPAANEAALGAVKAAVDKIAGSMDELPKEVRKPPVIATLTAEDAKAENILLWSLGIGDDDLSMPHAAILYGRGRRIGKVLSGDEISSSSVFEILSVIGQSCECGLDRDWMMGVQVPLIWDQDRRKTAAEQLGFDADSPLIQAEISQIMEIGRRGPNARVEDSEPLTAFMGYTEMTLANAPMEVVEEPPTQIEKVDPVEPRGESSKPENQPSDQTMNDQAIAYAPAAVGAARPSNPLQQENEAESPYTIPVIVLCATVCMALCAGGWIALRSRSHSA
ncbi:MAG: hypothetical protein GC154_04285 [bacterium]|nr:hypothetical protein [bacterium]